VYSPGTSQTSWFLFGLSTGVALLALVGACSISTSTSEIDSYDAAVQSSTADGALAFIKTHPTSHLVTDLVESLPPNVAVQICGDLPAGTASKAVRACDQLRDTLAAKGTAPDGTIQLAAAAPIAAPTAPSDCVARSVVLSADPLPAKAKAKRSASTPSKAKAKQAPLLVQIASVERGNKEVRH
jgi:hypothetical protein